MTIKTEPANKIVDAIEATEDRALAATRRTDESSNGVSAYGD